MENSEYRTAYKFVAFHSFVAGIHGVETDRF